MERWNAAKVWTGDERQKCASCPERIKVGDMSKQNATTGRIYHDLCAEDMGAYGPEFALGGVYGR